MKCFVCERELDDGFELHHLIPKTFKGKETVPIHPICHDAIHGFITEREMLNYYNTCDKIKAHSDVETFAKWISKKPIDFYVKTKDSQKRKGKR